MGQIFTTFGIDWRLLLMNAVNFGVLMFALWYFLYAPVSRLLEERRTKIAKGIEDANAAEARLAQIDQSRQGVLAAAGKEADSLIEEARAAARATESALRAQGEAHAQAAIKEAEMQAEELKAKALEDSKREIAKLIVLGIEKTAK